MQNVNGSEQAELIELALRGIDAQIAELERKRAALLGQVSRRATTASATETRANVSAIKARKRKPFSAAHRAKLRAAAQRRWAKHKDGAKQAAVKSPQASARKAVSKAK